MFKRSLITTTIGSNDQMGESNNGIPTYEQGVDQEKKSANGTIISDLNQTVAVQHGMENYKRKWNWCADNYYGLKQSPICWNSHLKNMGFVQGTGDPKGIRGKQN